MRNLGLAELEGRFYGGGVLELTPNEFKNLSIPYIDVVTDEQFNTLDNMLRESKSIEEVLSYTNSILFKSTDVVRLELIRKKLVNRRLKRDEMKKHKAEVVYLEQPENFLQKNITQNIGNFKKYYPLKEKNVV